MQDKHRKLGPFHVVENPDPRRPLSALEAKQYKEAYNLLADAWVLLTCQSTEEKLVECAMLAIQELLHDVPETVFGSSPVGKTTGTGQKTGE